MIATWQYVALGGVVTTVLAVLQYRSWRTGVRDSAFFPRLETTVASALAAQQFVLTSKTHTPKSFGHRSWHFERPPRAIYVYWDGKEREIIVGLQEPESRTPARRRIAVVGIEMGSPSDRYQCVLDELIEAITAAVPSDAQSPPAP